MEANKVKSVLVNEINSVTHYVTVNKLFTNIKDDVEAVSTQAQYLLGLTDTNDIEALMIVNDIVSRMKALDTYIKRFQAAKDIDSSRANKKITALENKIKELEEMIAYKEEYIAQIEESKEREITESIEEIKMQYENAETMAEAFDKILSLLDKLKSIDETVNAVNGISEYVKVLVKNKNRASEIADNSIAFKSEVDTDELVKDYEEQGKKVTKQLIEKYADRLTKQGIIERLKSAGKYEGRKKL